APSGVEHEHGRSVDLEGVPHPFEELRHELVQIEMGEGGVGDGFETGNAIVRVGGHAGHVAQSAIANTWSRPLTSKTRRVVPRAERRSIRPCRSLMRLSALTSTPRPDESKNSSSARSSTRS